MGEESAVQQARQRARGGWWEDGLTEILTGTVLMYIGGVGYLKETATGNAATAWTSLWVVGTVLLPLLGQRILRWLKGRWVWPYAGYVRPRRRSHVLLPLGALMLLAAVAVLLGWLGLWATGLTLGLFLAVGIGSQVPRFRWLGGLALLAGLGLDRSPLPPIQGFFLLLAVVGLLLLGTGLLTWHRFRQSLREVAHGG